MNDNDSPHGAPYMKHYRFSITLAIISVVLAASFDGLHAQATLTAVTDFKPIYRTEDTTLALSGVGQLRYLGFIQIYNGALYLPRAVQKVDVLENIPKRLEVKYLRSFKAVDFGTATIEGVRKNVDSETFTRLEGKIKQHNNLYEDIVRGDRVSLTYIPSIGTRVGINGVTKGTIPGEEFARALFSLWLGDKPFDSGFKRALLGEK